MLKDVGKFLVQLSSVDNSYVIMITQYYGDVWFSSSGQFFTKFEDALNYYELLNENSIDSQFKYNQNRGQCND
jgi:hypothetical protein